MAEKKSNERTVTEFDVIRAREIEVCFGDEKRIEMVAMEHMVKVVVHGGENRHQLVLSTDSEGAGIDIYNSKEEPIMSLNVYDLMATSGHDAEPVNEFTFVLSDDHDNTMLKIGTESTPRGRRPYIELIRDLETSPERIPLRELFSQLGYMKCDYEREQAALKAKKQPA